VTIFTEPEPELRAPAWQAVQEAASSPGAPVRPAGGPELRPSAEPSERAASAARERRVRSFMGRSFPGKWVRASGPSETGYRAIVAGRGLASR